MRQLPNGKPYYLSGVRRQGRFDVEVVLERAGGDLTLGVQGPFCLFTIEGEGGQGFRRSGGEGKGKGM